jgi:hypothetical protein
MILKGNQEAVDVWCERNLLPYLKEVKEKRLKIELDNIGNIQQDEDLLTLKSSKISKDEQDKDTHIAILQNKVTEIQHYKRFKKLQLNDEELKAVVDVNRKKNKTINYSKLGKALGVRHPTAKAWCVSRGIK